jgi:hypothetical protein
VCIAFHVTVAGVKMAKQIKSWKHALRSSNIIPGRIYWKKQNLPNTHMKKATKYIGINPGSYKLNLTSYTGNKRNQPKCLCSANQIVNPVWKNHPSGLLSSARKSESFNTVQFNIYLYHRQGNWKFTALLNFKNLWDSLNFTWLISKKSSVILCLISVFLKFPCFIKSCLFNLI